MADDRSLEPIRAPEDLPEWQRVSIRRVSDRARWICFVALVVIGAISLLVKRLVGFPGSAFGTAFLMAFLFVPPVIVSLAYRQGVRDARLHGDRGATPTI